MSEAHEAGRADYWKARALAAEGKLEAAKAALNHTEVYYGDPKNVNALAVMQRMMHRAWSALNG